VRKTEANKDQLPATPSDRANCPQISYPQASPESLQHLVDIQPRFKDGSYNRIVRGEGKEEERFFVRTVSPKKGKCLGTDIDQHILVHMMHTAYVSKDNDILLTKTTGEMWRRTAYLWTLRWER